jgi:hypothetical protein
MIYRSDKTIFMMNIKMYEHFVNESPEMPNLPQIRTQNSEVAMPTSEQPVTREQEAMRARLESDVKRMYPNLSIRHTPDGQSGVALNNNVIYATDHYEAFNAFLFGLVMGKMQGGREENNMVPTRY